METKRAKTVDEYIASFPPDTQEALAQVRQAVRRVAPDAEESISYGMPGYKVNGRPLVYFAAFKSHIGLYPLPSAIEAFKDDLSRYKHAKGSIQFPLSEPMPLDLIERMVAFRARENQTPTRRGKDT